MPPRSEIDAIAGADGPVTNISLTPFDQGFAKSTAALRSAVIVRFAAAMSPLPSIKS